MPLHTRKTLLYLVSSPEQQDHFIYMKILLPLRTLQRPKSGLWRPVLSKRRNFKYGPNPNYVWFVRFLFVNVCKSSIRKKKEKNVNPWLLM